MNLAIPNNIQIVPYQPKLEQAHIDFATQYWKKKRRLTPSYIYWKFRGVPGQELWSFLLAVAEGKVIGQLGLVPCKVKLGENIYEAQWACDLMVDNAYRGRSVAKLLYETAHRLKPITLGSDPSPAAFKSMTRAGYLQLAGPIKFLLPVSIGETLQLKTKRFSFLNKVQNPLLPFLKWFGGKSSHTMVITNGQDIKEKIHLHRKSLLFPAVVYDESFFNWRGKDFLSYYKAPQFFSNAQAYVFFTNGSGNLVVNDWYAPDLKDTAGILWKAVCMAKENKQSYIKILANTAEQIKQLKKLGLLKFRTQTNIIYYCSPEVQNLLALHNQFYYTFWDSDENI